MVRVVRLERTCSCSRSRWDNQLPYTLTMRWCAPWGSNPEHLRSERRTSSSWVRDAWCRPRDSNPEPTASQTVRSSDWRRPAWCAARESNPEPPALEAGRSSVGAAARAYLCSFQGAETKKPSRPVGGEGFVGVVVVDALHAALPSGREARQVGKPAAGQGRRHGEKPTHGGEGASTPRCGIAKREGAVGTGLVSLSLTSSWPPLSRGGDAFQPAVAGGPN